MAEYALTMDGGTTVSRIEKFKEAPVSFDGHPTKSAWKWLEVTRLDPAQGQSEGWSLDIDAGTATYRPAYVAPTPRKVGTFIEFMELFTPAEQLAIKAASQQDAALGLWYDKALGRPKVDLEEAAMSEGLDALVSAGLIKAARKTEILDWDFDA